MSAQKHQPSTVEQSSADVSDVGKADKQTIALAAAGIVVLVVLAIAIFNMIPPPISTVVSTVRINRPENMPVDEFVVFRERQGRLLRSDFLLRKVEKDRSVQNTEFAKKHRKRKELTKALSNALSVTTPSDSELISLTFACPHEDEAKTILNEIISEYRTEIIDEARFNRSRMIADVKSRYKDLIRFHQYSIEIEKIIAGWIDEGTSSVDLDAWHAKVLAAKEVTTNTDEREMLRYRADYIDRRINRIGSEMDLAEEAERLKSVIVWYKGKIDRIAADIVNWEAHDMPTVEVVQYAESLPMQQVPKLRSPSGEASQAANASQ